MNDIQRRMPATRLLGTVLLTLCLLLGSAHAQDEITIGWIPWDEDVAVSYLWQHLLEEQGYEVELLQVDVAPLFAGLAGGDVDVFLDAWLPSTHGDYWDRFGGELEDLGHWYDEAILGLAVPSYVDVDSLAQLGENASTFGERIVGIEAGAGMMAIARDDLIPAYGLDDWFLLEGSTPAMLAELDRAVSREEPIIVTMWSPHWAVTAYDLKYLEDPQDVWPPAEQIHTVARSGFSNDFPEVAGWLQNFKLSDEALGELEILINESNSPEQAVQKWLEDEENRQLVDSWVE